MWLLVATSFNITQQISKNDNPIHKAKLVICLHLKNGDVKTILSTQSHS